MGAIDRFLLLVVGRAWPAVIAVRTFREQVGDAELVAAHRRVGQAARTAGQVIAVAIRVVRKIGRIADGRIGVRLLVADLEVVAPALGGTGEAGSEAARPPGAVAGFGEDAERPLAAL